MKYTKQRSDQPKRGFSLLSPKILLSYIFVGGSCFYCGLMVGSHTASPRLDVICTSTFEERKPAERQSQSEMELTISKQSNRIQSLQKILTEAQQKVKIPQGETTEDTSNRFPKSVNKFVGGAALVDRTAFAERFDVGIPLEKSGIGNEDVLLLYAHRSAVPASDPYKAVEASSNTGLPDYGEDIEVATENCDKLNLVLVQPNEKTNCYALMGQFRGFHIHNFMRLPEHGKLDRTAPLKLTNRGAQASGRLSVKVPQKEQTEEYWKTLAEYLQNLDTTLAELRPYAEKAVVDNTVVVLVCNHGQSELLMNFACSSRARGFDPSKVLVFATDEETRDLAHGLGLNVFYDEKNFGQIPKRAAGRYADYTFTLVMMAKVYCVQMTMMLGFDVLFQDVDVVWYKNPIQFFQDKSSKIYNFDMYFQDDGSRGVFYAPYSANTGFYYVRNNDKTRHFFNSLLLSGDLISSTHSHQIALVSLLSEHASLFNLKVKVLERDTEEFPGGFTFHKRSDYMKDFFNGKVHPYIFHMSWTENKNNKQKFFRQMGSWYLEDKCIHTTVDEIMKKDNSITRDGDSSGHLLEACCSAEPLITCFFKDKPSIGPCPDGKILDEGKRSFW